MDCLRLKGKPTEADHDIINLVPCVTSSVLIALYRSVMVIGTQVFGKEGDESGRKGLGRVRVNSDLVTK